MNYNKEILEKNQVKFTVEVASEDWKEAINQAYLKTKGKFSIPGFRKGKVPKSIIEKNYGAGIFFDDALDIILPKCYGEILDKETEVYPVARPDIDIVAISDTDLKFTALVTVKPEVKLGEYKGLEIKKVEYPVSDDMVQSEIDNALNRASSWESVSDRACKKGDMTVIDFSGSVDGVKFEGGTAEKQNLELGSGMFIPGFEEQVEGMSIGDEKDIEVTFPADYGAEELAGKKAVFAVKLHEIKEKHVPELNDEFAQDVSEFDTLEAYKADIRKGLETVNNEKAENETETAMIETIAEKCEIDIPDAMIESQIEDMIEEFEYRLAYQGMKAEDYYKYTNSTRDELAARYRSVAEKNVRLRLVMEAIVKAEDIKCEESEIDAKLEKFAEGAKKSFEEYKKSVNPQQIAYIQNEIATDKLMKFLKENNKFVK